MDRRSFFGLFAGLGAFLFAAPGPPTREPKPGRKGMTWWSWGFNEFGETAKGFVTNPFPHRDTPASVSTVPSSAISLGCAEDTGTAVTSAGEIYVWGNNDVGVLVSGTTYGSQFGSQFHGPNPRPPVTTATKLTYADAVNIVASDADVDALFWLRSDNTLWALGVNYTGAFGNGEPSFTYHATPVQIAANAVAFAIGGGGSVQKNTYYIDTSGDLWFSGLRTLGQAGDGTTGGPVLTFQKVTALSNVTRIWASGAHVFALAGGVLYAWGRNSSGELGIGNNTQQNSPVAVTTLPVGAVVADILPSESAFSYFLLADGRLFTTGYGISGELGLGAYANVNTPAQATVGAGLSVSSLAFGGNSFPNSGAVVAGGKYWATGANDNHQVEYSGTAYNTFQNLITFPGTVQRIAFVGDQATFVLVGRRARSWAQVIGL